MTQPPNDQTQDETVEAAGPQGPTAPAGDADVDQAEAPEAPAADSLETQLSERTADLQRLQAEYVNYRRRVDRDRQLSRQQGEAAVLRSMLTVLDDVGRADQHGELTGGFKAVADSLNQALKAHKLEAFGATGDAFDPKLHEALYSAGTAPGIDRTSVAEVVRQGYRVGEEVLRHAQVGVVEPAADEGSAEPAAE